MKTDTGKQLMVRGFQDVEAFRDVISYITDGEMKPIEVPPREELLQDLLMIHGYLAGEELFCAFDFSDRDAADQWVEELIAQGKLKKKSVGNSYFVEAQ